MLRHHFGHHEDARSLHKNWRTKHKKDIERRSWMLSTNTICVYCVQKHWTNQISSGLKLSKYHICHSVQWISTSTCDTEKEKLKRNQQNVQRTGRMCSTNCASTTAFNSISNYGNAFVFFMFFYILIANEQWNR